MGWVMVRAGLRLNWVWLNNSNWVKGNLTLPNLPHLYFSKKKMIWGKNKNEGEKTEKKPEILNGDIFITKKGSR